MKNIIPQDYSIYNRDGIYLDSPTSSPNNRIIDTFASFDWLEDINENIPYYPVLPRYKANGEFYDEGGMPADSSNPSQEDGYYGYPFPGNWIETSYSYYGKHSFDKGDASEIIYFSNKTIDVNVLDDKSGNNNKGFIINDYKPKFNSKTFEIKKTKILNTIKKSKKNRAH